MNYESIIAQQKSAANAAKNVSDTIHANKEEVRLKAMSEIFDLLQVIQLDEQFTFNEGKPLITPYSYTNDTRETAVLKLRERTMKEPSNSTWHDVSLTNINCRVWAKSTEDFMPMYYIKIHISYNPDVIEEWETMEAFTKSLVQRCIRYSKVKQF